MIEVLQMFLFLFKSKYRRKYNVTWSVNLCTFLYLGYILLLVESKCQDSSNCSDNGVCKNNTCVCYDGWKGSHCQYCSGKVRLGAASGIIHDGYGNYSLGTKCSWLIDASNYSITLHIEEFATECGWDHLYVFDGDSVESPLLAVFSGLMYKDSYRIRKIPEVVVQSGSALLHFFSDDAYNMSGFNISYRLNACPSTLSDVDCSGHGVCIEGVCTCDGRWTGAACHIEKCPNNCWVNASRGTCEYGKGCICRKGWKGEDCGQATEDGYWENVATRGFTPPGSASHGVAVWRDSMYIVAGESYNRGQMLYVYDFNGYVWETPHISDGGLTPLYRYAHSTVLYGDKIFIYGGVLGNRGPTSELWAFDVNAKTWENITVRAEICNGSNLLCGPLKSAGHTATLVTKVNNKKDDRMIVIFGHSPLLGYLNTVQEYYFGTREWFVVTTRGYPVKGGYGHSASWDPLTNKVYVYGGIISESASTQTLSTNLYSYEPDSRMWTCLSDGPSARYLHSGTFVSPGLLLVFGGNTHNDTSHSFGAKCYGYDLLTYDVVCDTWHVLNVTRGLPADLARYGHSAVTFEGSLYIYGGFDGQMLSDILKYTPGSCEHLINKNSCLGTRPGVKCVWDRKGSKCMRIQDVPNVVKTLPIDEEELIMRCPEEMRSSRVHTEILRQEKCSRAVDCASCVQTTRNCVWCSSGVCSYNKCRDNSSERGITHLDQCPTDLSPTCRQLHTCTACISQTSCSWKYELNTKCIPYPTNISIEPALANNAASVETAIQCQRVCSEYTSCRNCTQEECIWCQNEGRCVDKNAYTVSFPYGQCREWTTTTDKCRSARGAEEKSQCSFYMTCAQCRDDPACGWCDDGSKTGLGRCLPGGYTGPTLHTQSLPSSTCPHERWHFTNCPVCQCNGHSKCQGNTSACVQCDNLTTGSHCEKCMAGYWGNPVNGGRCQPCECNGQASQCQHDTGKCYCTTKGLTGDHCEKCDVANHYHPDPLNKGACYYDLTIDYQFTFNLSKKEDRHYTQINFRNSPTKPDIDADFHITCSVLAKMNITIRRANSKEEKPIHTNQNCTTFKYKFLRSDYIFGTEDNVTLTTFYVYVYDFQPPLWIQISFSQYPKLNLQQFFITFSTCFLLLLLAAAILWKIKQRYDMYRRRQRLFVEMEQMASRPFSQVLVELEVKDVNDRTDDSAIYVLSSADPLKKHGKKRDAPSPIALEPCFGNRAAVLSLLVRLPTGGERHTVKGQSSGLAIASALVTLGNPRKLSIDPVKTDTGTKTTKTRKVLLIYQQATIFIVWYFCIDQIRYFRFL
ncbi:attractin isoform X2 [Agrilus planipennis]|uniref:Attractin isoform X2 n=1 Tax=Agrilus planipennis TaxID=224129 RepID=A0A1W4XB92_AGRPL|nr:attractin isoform X2 [Agrilus planipennis]